MNDFYCDERRTFIYVGKGTRQEKDNIKGSYISSLGFIAKGLRM